jgi:hypothetical protein
MSFGASVDLSLGSGERRRNRGLVTVPGRERHDDEG